MSGIPTKAKKLVIKDSKNTDDKGMVVFKDVPVNNYVICVDDSKNFMGNEKSLELIGEQVIQESFNLFIELKPQEHSFTEIVLQDEAGQNISQASVTALLLTTTEPLEVDRNFIINSRLSV